MLLKIFKRRRKWYQHNRWHFALDIGLSLLILIILTILVSLNVLRPQVDSFNPFLRPKEPTNNVDPIIVNPLKLEASLNKNIVSENEELIISLKLNNTGSQAISDISVKLLPLNSNFNLKTNSYYIDEILNSTEKDLELKTSVSLNNKLVRKLDWLVEISFNYLETNFEQKINLPSLLFRSQTSISANAYYHNLRGDQLGIGPIPPIVGIPTSYLVFFELSNFGNDLDNFVLSANLAKRVKLTKVASLLAGNYNYNEDNKRIVWQINNINQQGGNYQAAFELTIVPEIDDVGKSLDLINSLSYSYKDALTKEQITANLGKIDNSLPFDFINKDQSIVRE